MRRCAAWSSQPPIDGHRCALALPRRSQGEASADLDSETRSAALRTRGSGHVGLSSGWELPKEGVRSGPSLCIMVLRAAGHLPNWPAAWYADLDASSAGWSRISACEEFETVPS